MSNGRVIVFGGVAGAAISGVEWERWPEQRLGRMTR
jgi:hypothetical protein